MHAGALRATGMTVRAGDTAGAGAGACAGAAGVVVTVEGKEKNGGGL